MQTLVNVVVAISVVVVVVCHCAAAQTSKCRRQQQKSSSSSALSTAPIVVVVSVAVVAYSSRQCRQCGSDMRCIAVFLQTGVLRPYPVALLATDAPSLPVILPPLRRDKKKRNKNLSLLPTPTFRADPGCWL